MRSRVAARCGRIVESSWFDPLMLGIISVNAVTLGLETYASIDAAIGEQLRLADGVILGLFVVELLIRMGAYHEKAHRVVLEERLRTLRAAVDELEREVRAKS